MDWRKLSSLLLCLFFTACWIDMDSSDSSEKGDISIIRYDRLQKEYVSLDSYAALQKMNTLYADQTRILIEEVLTLGQVSDVDINQKMQTFYSDTTLLRLMADVEEKFSDLSGLEKELNNGFKRLKKELPSISIPSVYVQLSALNESIVVGDSLLGISLDKYMGADYPLYSRFYYNYQQKSMTPERIAPDCFSFYILGNYPFYTMGRRTLLDVMLHRGKINYAVQMALDYSSPGKVIGYTSEEEQWCRKNMKAIWDYLLQSGQIYSTDPMVIRAYLRPAPASSFSDSECPAMVGSWLGSEIIHSYMKKNKKVTLEELMNMTDYPLILAESGFTPK